MGKSRNVGSGVYCKKFVPVGVLGAEKLLLNAGCMNGAPLTVFERRAEFSSC